MHTHAHDPLGKGGLKGGLTAFAAAFRAGTLTSEAATRAYLARIDAFDGRLGAYQHVARDSALATARAMDALIAAGTDLGPLMGVPIAVKDLIAVDGMPTRAGTLLAVDDLIGPEGPVVARLRRAGCVILGKVKTVEFALGITGVSAPLGTPVNPWDAADARLPGGSSSGSGVATAAGLCAFAVGSDTGGSVRVPAALNGVFGLKTGFGRLPNAGAFPLAAHLDSIGFLTRSARDAAIVYATIAGDGAAIEARPASSLRLGRPAGYFFDDLAPEIADRTAAAIAAIADAGARIHDIDVPEAPEREAYFPLVLPVCLVASLGRERVAAGLASMDPVVATRVASGLDTRAVEFLQLETKRARSRESARARFAGLDGWISPTTAVSAARVADLDAPETGLAMALGASRNTQPANYLDLPAASLPLPMAGYSLPAGLQVMCPPGQEATLLSICVGLEELLGAPELPDVSAFAAGA